MTMERVEMGAGGEDLACDALKARGYAILARRFRTRTGELDIVARDGNTLVFVEVKARRSVRAGLPAEAVTWRKRRTLHRVALEFLARSRLHHLPCRFDVVSVRLGPRGEATEVEILPGAFLAGE
jgi:putative endonuclease